MKTIKHKGIDFYIVENWEKQPLWNRVLRKGDIIEWYDGRWESNGIGKVLSFDFEADCAARILSSDIEGYIYAPGFKYYRIIGSERSLWQRIKDYIHKHIL